MKYVTIAICSIPTGTLVRLSDAQAASRLHALKPSTGKGWFEAVHPLQFKVGETIELKGDAPPKSMAEAVVDPAAESKTKAEAEEKAAADAKAKAEADAKAAGGNQNLV